MLNMASSTLHAIVRSRQGIAFEGELTAVSSVNRMGPFDVLPEHANFVSMILQHVILHKPDGQIEEYTMDNGVLLVEKNEVRVFLGVSKM